MKNILQPKCIDNTNILNQVITAPQVSRSWTYKLFIATVTNGRQQYFIIIGSKITLQFILSTTSSAYRIALYIFWNGSLILSCPKIYPIVCIKLYFHFIASVPVSEDIRCGCTVEAQRQISVVCIGCSIPVIQYLAYKIRY